MRDFSKIDYREVFARFWSRVWIKGVDECWPWNGASRARKKLGSVGTIASYPMLTPSAESEQPRRVFHRVTAQRMAAIAMGMCTFADKVRVTNTCGNGLCCNPRHLHVSGSDDAFGIAVSDPGGYTGHRKSKAPPGPELDAFTEALMPLRDGKSVILSMDDPRLTVVKKFHGRRSRAVVLVPSSVIDSSTNFVLVSVIGLGSVVVRLDRPPKVADLVLAGMPARLAGVLMEKLHRVFQET